jgi:hypothetical protein
MENSAMAAVARCPYCKQELDVPDGAGADEWMNCPTCRAAILVGDMERSEVQEAASTNDAAAEPADKAISPTSLPAELKLELGSESLFGFGKGAGEGDDSSAPSSAPTVEDIRVSDAAEPIETSRHLQSAAADERVTRSDQGTDDEPQLTESGEMAAKRIDKWFRGADTVPDVPTVVSEDSPDERSPLTSPTDENIETVVDLTGERSSGEEEGAAPEWSAPFSAELPSVHTPTDEDFGGEPVVDLQPPSSADAGATMEFSADSLDATTSDADFEIEEVEVDRDLPTWDDPERMEQLLAGVDGARPDENDQAGRDDSEQSENRDESDQETIPPIVATPHRKRRRRSVAMLVAGSILGGFAGIALGCYALLWIFGRDGDFFEIARFVPSALLPEEFQTAPAQLAADMPLTHQAGDTNAETAPPIGSRVNQAEPAEVTASYEAPAATTTDSSAIVGERYADDRYATPASATAPAETDPLAFDEPATAPIDTSAAAVVADAPSYTAEQLARGLEIGREARAGLVNGELSDQAVQRTKGLSYTKLSYLAELVTFVDSQAQPEETQSLRQDAEALFRDTLSNLQTRNEVAYIATKWIDSPHRNIGGVFVAGSIANQQAAGSVVEYQVEMGAGSPLTVLAPASMTEGLEASGRTIGIVGSVVDDPATRISGYTGSAVKAIWAGMLIPLE